MEASAISHPPLAFLICPLDAEFQVDDYGCEVSRMAQCRPQVTGGRGEDPVLGMQLQPPSK